LTIGTGISESVAEEALLEWFSALGYEVLHGPDIAPGTPAAERDDYREVVLAGRLREAVRRLNPEVPAAALEEAVRRVLRPESAATVLNNRRFHRMLVPGFRSSQAS
jgi:type I restriction enzyme R subunit